MSLAKQVEHIEVDSDQMDALLSYASEHGVSLRQAVKEAVEALSKQTRRRPVGYRGRRSEQKTLSVEIGPEPVTQDIIKDQKAVRQSARMAAKRRLAEHGIAAVTLTIDGEPVTDGMAYQKRIRAEW